MKKTQQYIMKALFYAFLIAYVLLLGKALFFKQVSIPDLFDVQRIISRPTNFVPFKTINEFMYANIWIALMNLAGNIALFVPMGIYLQIFTKHKKVIYSVAAVGLISLCVEIIQYVFGVGYADIDDLILNTLGGFLGVIVYRIIYSFMKDDTKTRDMVTILYGLLAVGCAVCYLVFVGLLGYRIRIF